MPTLNFRTVPSGLPVKFAKNFKIQVDADLEGQGIVSHITMVEDLNCPRIVVDLAGNNHKDIQIKLNLSAPGEKQFSLGICRVNPVRSAADDFDLIVQAGGPDDLCWSYCSSVAGMVRSLFNTSWFVVVKNRLTFILNVALDPPKALVNDTSDEEYSKKRAAPDTKSNMYSSKRMAASAAACLESKNSREARASKRMAASAAACLESKNSRDAQEICATLLSICI